MLKTYSADSGKLYEFNSCPNCYWQSQRGITREFKDFKKLVNKNQNSKKKGKKKNVRSIHNNTKRTKKTHKRR